MMACIVARVEDAFGQTPERHPALWKMAAAVEIL